MSRALSLDASRALIERPEVRRLLGALAASGEETRIVGGAVRNALLGREVTDIDLATTALPRDTMKRARAAGLKAVPTGIEHGTVTVVADGWPFEVTTLREDVETDGRHAVVRFGRSFEHDALRRDFTINALSVGGDGRVQDYTGGMSDLAAGRVRFIGDARKRIREDFLRVLRFFRFTAEYAVGRLDPEGLDAAIRERDGLDLLSRERVRAELLKLISARHAVEVVATLSDTGLLLRIVGGVPELGRLARAVAAGLDPTARLGALLVRSRVDPPRLKERLRLSNAEAEFLEALAYILERSPGAALWEAADLRRLAAVAGVEPLMAGLAILAGEPRPQLTAIARDQAARFAAGDGPPVFPLAGADVIAGGTPAGPAVGRRLREEREAWLLAGAPAVWTLSMPGGAIRRFDWDDRKHARNVAERGFGFDFAALIFGDDTLERDDDRHSYGERRIQALGAVGLEVLAVIYTDRGSTRWIISARRANRKERRQWHAR